MNKQYNLILLLFAFTVFWGTSGYAQKASIRVAPKSFLIGDQAELTIELNVKKNAHVIWPSFIDSTAAYKIEVIDRGAIDTLKSDTSKWITFSQKLKITTFDTGNVVLDPMSFYDQDSTLIAISDSFQINVSTIAVDTTKAFMDIQDTLDEHLRFSELLPWILLGLGIFGVLAFALFIYYRRKNKKPIFGFSAAKVLPAHEIAINALNQLKEKRLWQQGLVKAYYSELTDIIRQYLYQRYGIEAMEMLSSEICSNLALLPELNSYLSSMQQLLYMADMVKFAKENPLPNENDLFLSFALEFVQKSALVESNNSDNQSVNN